ncbi:MAG TPA: hypothetical protein VFE63_17325 [Roseiarcus sp.]|nr:hypothetical protein [Roseiarcus sp.]
MTTKSSSENGDRDLLRIIVEEVDEAREVHELARQLIHALPLRSMDDVAKAVGGHGNITFRGVPYTVANFANVVPSVLFPIDSVEKLVTLLAATVRLAPRRLPRGPDDGYAKSRLRRLGLFGLGGRIGLMGNPRRTQNRASAHSD